MPNQREYRFKLEVPYTPETFPMARLAEYLKDLAALMGESAAVHFVRVEEGSVTAVQIVDDAALPKVRERVQRTRIGDGPPDAMAAAKRINNKLREDNGSAGLDEGETNVIEFPGVKETVPEAFVSLTQRGTLDGVPIKVGGPNEIVPVLLQSGASYSKCAAERPLAKQIAPYMFTHEVRLHGAGKWTVTSTGDWRLDRFTIESFEVLDSTPLLEVVADLRAMPGNEWSTLDDPWRELSDIRDGRV